MQLVQGQQSLNPDQLGEVTPQQTGARRWRRAFGYVSGYSRLPSLELGTEDEHDGRGLRWKLLLRRLVLSPRVAHNLQGGGRAYGQKSETNQISERVPGGGRVFATRSEPTGRAVSFGVTQSCRGRIPPAEAGDFHRGGGKPAQAGENRAFARVEAGSEAALPSSEGVEKAGS